MKYNILFALGIYLTICSFSLYSCSPCYRKEDVEAGRVPASWRYSPPPPPAWWGFYSKGYKTQSEIDELKRKADSENRKQFQALNNQNAKK